MQEATKTQQKNRDLVVIALKQLQAVLSEQVSPVHSIHHNIWQGFSHLTFEQVLAEKQALTGLKVYFSEDKFRDFYQQGRINDCDINAAIIHFTELHGEQIVCSYEDKIITRQDIYKLALLFDFSAITISQLNWQIEELNAFNAPQGDIKNSYTATEVRKLWQSILARLDLREEAVSHPEALLDISLEQIEEWLVDVCPDSSVHEYMQQQAGVELDKLLENVGDTISLRGFILALSGVDVLDSTQSQLIRLCASALDEGVAVWHLPENKSEGFYAAWRASVHFDANLFLHELPDWQKIMDKLPNDAIDTIVWHLIQMEIPQHIWSGYLQRLALELPGWSGIIFSRNDYSAYGNENVNALKLADYLAIRLTLDRLWLNQACHDLWRVEANLGILQGYFRKNLSEFMVRKNLYQGNLPEYLTQQVKLLANRAVSERQSRKDWQYLADLIWMWQFKQIKEHSVCNSGWRLFRLCQHLGLKADDLEQLNNEAVSALLAQLNEFTDAERSKVWLFAYEYHYRQEFFQKISANHNRGSWATRILRPEAQIIYGIDTHQEIFRSSLEELNPAIETLGAIGLSGFDMHYKSLDGENLFQHEPDSESRLKFNRPKSKLTHWVVDLLHNGLRSNPLVSFPVIVVIAPVTLVALLLKSLLPEQHKLISSKLSQWFLPKIPSQSGSGSAETSDSVFIDKEYIERIAEFFHVTGLTSGFAPLIVFMEQLSDSNPCYRTLECAACEGINVRVFAAMLNSRTIREGLNFCGIIIPEDTWFIAAEFNANDESIEWYDLEDIPQELRDGFDKLQLQLLQARQMSAHEHCRKLASVPPGLTYEKTLAQIEERASDFSQIGTESGYSTHAAAVIGRRSLTQGANFDGRVFLVSYDPVQDVEGKVLERILLAILPVIEGINMEYYFSTVNNNGFGSGSIVDHNITGLFGVMEGASSDLLRGLPRQMLETHEAMRLQVLIEANPEMLEGVFARQQSIRQFVTGGWLHLSAKDPDDSNIYFFDRSAGFVLWQAEASEILIRDVI